MINFNGTSYIMKNWFEEIPEKTTQHSTKLMQLNYSHLRLLKLKI